MTVVSPTLAKDRVVIGGNAADNGTNAIWETLRDIRIYNYALDQTALDEIYRNPFDLYAQFDRDDDYQFFTASAPIVSVTPPALSSR